MILSRLGTVVRTWGRSQHIEDRVEYRRRCRVREAGSVRRLGATCRVSGVVSMWIL